MLNLLEELHIIVKLFISLIFKRSKIQSLLHKLQLQTVLINPNFIY